MEGMEEKQGCCGNMIEEKSYSRLLFKLGKIFHKSMKAMLVNWYERKDKINERQSGFRKSRDTAIESIIWKMEQMNKKKVQCGILVVTLDLLKAFK